MLGIERAQDVRLNGSLDTETYNFEIVLFHFVKESSSKVFQFQPGSDRLIDANRTIGSRTNFASVQNPTKSQ